MTGLGLVFNLIESGKERSGACVVAKSLADVGEAVDISNRRRFPGRRRQYVRVQSTLFDASQFSAAVEQAIDLLARQARAFARGEQEDRAVTVAALTKPSGQHQLLIQQRVLMLAKFFDSVQ